MLGLKPPAPHPDSTQPQLARRDGQSGYLSWLEGVWPASVKPYVLLAAHDINLLDVFFGEKLRPRIRNWTFVAAGIAERVGREARNRDANDARSSRASRRRWSPCEVRILLGRPSR
jgi:hypothetical protein